MGTAPSTFAALVRFRIGALVAASDDEVGELTQVLVDPGTRTISRIGIRLGRLRGHVCNLPIELVEEARTDLVRLAIPRAEVEQKALDVPDGFISVNGSTIVYADGTRLGRLIQISARKYTGGVWRLVVQRGLVGGEALVPIDATATFEAGRIGVSLSAGHVKALVAYRPDDELVREANDALFNYPRLRIDLRAVRVLTADGDLWLCGHISSDLNRRMAEEQVQGIDGVAAVHNELVADTDLANAVAAALAEDPRTHGQHIGVYPDLGEVYLRGAVNTPAARDAAASVADAVPGVERVHNELIVRPGLDVVPVLSSVTARDEQVPGGR
jgi:osmotically-inducible protein OsmY